ncbi:autoinducer binding domain-containing protein [Pseudomonas sp. TCU-HL1]|uniref:autoinducer binding domain-containing protein n=1 Tax=Pseudomonas sp. TCU-HL1 TaxID=1856685 RepID=UPI0009F19631|nr:autoinducer binding domain-containing protein [Pseudomonas sp. TCU-HL1]
MDFEFISYRLRYSIPITAPRVFTLNNYPEAWNKEYEQNNYFASDPIIKHCLSSNSPITWSEQSFSSNRTLYEHAKAFGLSHGWTQSSWATPCSKGFVSLSRSAIPISRKELDSKEARMSSLVREVHACVSEVLMPAHPPRLHEALSLREIEILKWIADGKTGEVIGQLLGITERTVTYHAVSIMQKMDVTNRTAAAVKAVLLGII